MNKWILKSNKWYDNVREPYRFLYLLFVMVIILTIPRLYNDNYLTFAFLHYYKFYRFSHDQRPVGRQLTFVISNLKTDICIITTYAANNPT